MLTLHLEQQAAPAGCVGECLLEGWVERWGDKLGLLRLDPRPAYCLLFALWLQLCSTPLCIPPAQLPHRLQAWRCM